MKLTSSGAHAVRRHDQVAFVFAILIVHDHRHFAAAQVFEDFVDGIECGIMVVLALQYSS